jgi:HCOMODA/2-hydroxy-3-carboxy-muconic semialdehyde decarboxylase
MADGPRELVLANRIVAREGIVDAFGHVSLRDPANADRFLISRSLAPARVTEADVQVLDLDRRRVTGDERASYAEVAIHAEIYRARADVMAVCHSHSPSAVVFGVSRVPLRPVFHMGSLIGGDVPTWDIAREFGTTDLLVRASEHGASLARTLGAGPAALMRGHGSVVVGARLADVVHTAYALEQNARVQLAGLSLGEVAYLTPEETEQARAMLLQPLASERAWDWFASRVS